MSGENGWGEYSRQILKELETLAKSIEGLRAELQDMKQELAAIRAKEDKVEELRSWKEKIDEVASPTQLKELTTEVQDLKIFKTKAITVFALVQFLMATALAALKVL
jgi:predicted  nucleic acid-binding Zn-ribbon protein